MNKYFNILFVFWIVAWGGGCASRAKPSIAVDSQQEALSALSAVAGTLSGQPMDEARLKKLARDVRTDKEAQAALQAVSGSLTQSGVSVKYCPVDGQRFTPRFERCPQHGVELKYVE